MFCRYLSVERVSNYDYGFIRLISPISSISSISLIGLMSLISLISQIGHITKDIYLITVSWDYSAFISFIV